MVGVLPILVTCVLRGGVIVVLSVGLVMLVAHWFDSQLGGWSPDGHPAMYVDNIPPWGIIPQVVEAGLRHPPTYAGSTGKPELWSWCGRTSTSDTCSLEAVDERARYLAQFVVEQPT